MIDLSIDGTLAMCLWKDIIELLIDCLTFPVSDLIHRLLVRWASDWSMENGDLYIGAVDWLLD